MCKSPFGLYHGDYDDANGYDDTEKSSQEYVRGKLSEADELFEQLSDMDEDDGWDEDWESPDGSYSPAPSEPSTQTERSPSPEKTPSVQARYLSDLTDKVVADGKLLLTEDGRAFAYQEDGRYYKLVTNLEAYLAKTLPPKITRNLLSRHFRELTERLSWENAIRCDLKNFNNDPNLVNLGNGVLNLTTSELLNHNSSNRFTYQIRASYLTDPSEISCPTFDQFCRTSLDGDPMKRQLLLEFIGYICLDSNAGKCALFLKGQPNSGKSVALEFITSLFDDEVISNIQLHDLGDKFGRAELAGKKLNSAGEIAGRALHDISVFKSITGSDRIEAEFKQKDHFRFVPQCKFLFSGNTLPHTSESDATNAFINRIRVLMFNQSIPPEEQDKCLGDKLWAERDAIVTLALQAAQKLIERNYEFTRPEDSRQFLKSFELRGNVLASFIEDCCALGPNERVFNVELYATFEAFCKRNGLERLSRTKFYELLSGIPHVTAKRIRIGTDNRQGHVGIALKKEAPNGGTLEQQP